MDPKQTQLKITPEIIKSQRTLTCDCGGLLFHEGFIFKKISAIISPNGKEEIFPINVIICEACGKVPSQFNVSDILPEEIIAKEI